MKQISFVCALVIAFAGGTFAQTAAQAPRPTPTPDDNQVVKISTNLIQIDVSVTDKNGKPVTDLRQDEIEISENGRLQKISHFSFVPGAKPVAKTSPGDKTDKSTVNLPSPALRQEQVRRTIALVVDDLNLSFGSMVWVREALKDFVEKQMQDGDLVAIIRTGAGVGALQQFTADRRQLLAAIERVKFNSAGTGALAFFNNVSGSMSQDVVTAPAAGLEPTPVDEFTIDPPNADDRATLDTRFNAFRENIFASGTLGALNFIVRGMNELPGRKSVILMSDGLQLVTRDAAGRPSLSRIHPALQHLIDRANRASVVFYTIHAPGLVAPMMEAADEVAGMPRLNGERTTTDILRARLDRINDSQEGLRYIADETGGLAYFNQNDIGRGIRRALDDQSYYLVGYEPDDETFNVGERRYNKFEVKIKREGVKVRYRSGFFAVSEEQIAKPRLSVTDTLINALTSPFAVNDISVRMNAIVAGDAKQGAVVRTFINVDAADLTFKSEADGRHTTSFDIVAITLGDRGQIVDERPKNIKLNLDNNEYKKFLKRGLVTTFALPIKTPGGYQVRLAIRDVATNRVGSANQYIEVPNLKKDKLLLSGMALENIALSTLQVANAEPNNDNQSAGDPLWDTAVRQFRRGSILRFGYHIYNAKLDGARKSKLAYHLKLYSGRELVFESRNPVVKIDHGGDRVLTTSGGIRLGDALPMGDYVLQVDITDLNAKDRTATQFIQFEIVE